MLYVQHGIFLDFCGKLPLKSKKNPNRRVLQTLGVEADAIEDCRQCLGAWWMAWRPQGGMALAKNPVWWTVRLFTVLQVWPWTLVLKLLFIATSRNFCAKKCAAFEKFGV